MDLISANRGSDAGRTLSVLTNTATVGPLFQASFIGNGAGLDNISADAIVGGLTTNITIRTPSGGTNTLCFTNGLLRAVQ